MQNKIKTSKTLFLAYYTFSFALVSLLCFTIFFITKKILLTNGSDETQHITALAYYGNYLRTVLSNFFHGNFQIPQWDFNLGLGADIIQTLHYYAFGDPFALLSVFFKPEHTFIIYNVNIFLRLYFAGLTFLCYCKYHKFDEFSSFCGAFIYIFCGFTFYDAVRHPYFQNPLVWLPLLLLGIDWIFDKKNFLLLAFSVFIACASNFYFFYMLSILTVIYAVVRFFFKFPKSEYKNIWKYVLLAVAGYALGICMASFIFFPSVAGFLGSARTGEENKISFLYRPNYYIKMLLGFAVAPSTFGSYSVFGFAAPVLALTIFLFKQNDKISRQVKIFFLIGIIFFLFPIFGSIFNGFSYSTNRWCFAFSFVVSIGAVHILPKAMETDFNSLKKILFFCLAFCLLVFALAFISSDIKSDFAPAYIVLFLSTLILILFYYFKKPVKFLYLILIMISAVFSANFRYSQKGLNYLRKTPSNENLTEILNECTTSFPIDDNDFFRVETAKLTDTNASAAAKYKGTTYYWSIMDGRLYEFYKAQNMQNVDTEKSHGFFGRNDLENLLSVKYLLLESEQETVNDIFKNTGKKYLDYNIFENTEFQPFGFSESRKNEHLENVKTSFNTLTADCNFSGKSSVFLSIPYSKFWNAEIDGKVAEIKISNQAFMEMEIPEGFHRLKLTYRDAYFILGGIISICSTLMFVILLFFRLTKRAKCHQKLEKLDAIY